MRAMASTPSDIRSPAVASFLYNAVSVFSSFLSNHTPLHDLHHSNSILLPVNLFRVVLQVGQVSVVSELDLASFDKNSSGLKS